MMKSLLVYYSHYGNTAHVASEFSEALKKISTVENYELEFKGRRPGLLKRSWYRFFPLAVELAPIPTDMKNYDLLCLGVPVWGGRPSAPASKYISLCKNLENKKIICFFVYSIEISARRCFNYIRKALRKKGHPTVIDVFVPWERVHDKEYLDAQIQGVLEKVVPT